MIEVKSSNLSQVGYDGANQTLKVIFKNGDEYHYAEVPETVYQSLLTAESIGAFFGKYVRGSFKYKKIPKLDLI